MNERGYAAIGLDNPKSQMNIGGVLRACGCYGAGLVVIGGPRPERLSKLAQDTQKAWRHIPHVLVNDVFDAVPYSAVPVAVDLLEGAIPLPKYVHPERAFYIFGAEDATLGKRITERCRDRIMDRMMERYSLYALPESPHPMTQALSLTVEYVTEGEGV